MNNFGTDVSFRSKTERHMVEVTGVEVEKIFGMLAIESGKGYYKFSI
jgi:hypothetical protein